ncbi:crotonase/enoyl-CoA hydratase family protein [Sinimarinibacterium sp. CAU 1509]|uniref:crotonase/enoyl-CoA hydratase family protein n=1 Tax=Sinimarinibacterium sp. CAU 1509 TaxID=2562283 RepID=UPI0010ABAEA4|nr:crotonase/enoyl-CoA hydratase family protein [Sinimarinibacterium sp. CAU 1509]TJY59519.1 crotonase/enoyl-CoA hydratase family protein [Sinimarinibacterium sp. CAU 1509]
MTTVVPEFETLKIEWVPPLAWLHLNRPSAANAIDFTMWDELPRALAWLNSESSVRVVILGGAGKHFTAGIDFSVLEDLQRKASDPQRETRGREAVLDFIERAQSAFSAFERLRVPVIAAVNGACIGGGVDLIAACDLRLCTRDARFCVKEVDLAIVPDVGTLQRLGHVIGYSAVAELAYTGETFDAARAQALGLVSRICDSNEALIEAATSLARSIAGKSPAAVRGIKRNLLWARDHSVQDGLAYTAAWNAAMLVGEDLREAVDAYRTKRAPTFKD